MTLLNNLIKVGGSAVILKEIADRIAGTRINREQTLRRKNAGMLALGVAIGGTVGAVAGLLFAPKAGKETRSFNYSNLDFPIRAEDNNFLPRLWASRRVGWLLEQIRNNGETKETRDEVVDLLGVCRPVGLPEAGLDREDRPHGIADRLVDLAHA